jgi:hypothetical protein
MSRPSVGPALTSLKASLRGSLPQGQWSGTPVPRETPSVRHARLSPEAKPDGLHFCSAKQARVSGLFRSACARTLVAVWTQGQSEFVRSEKPRATGAAARSPRRASAMCACWSRAVLRHHGAADYRSGGNGASRRSISSRSPSSSTAVQLAISGASAGKCSGWPEPSRGWPPRVRSSVSCLSSRAHTRDEQTRGHAAVSDSFGPARQSRDLGRGARVHAKGIARRPLRWRLPFGVGACTNNRG